MKTLPNPCTSCPWRTGGSATNIPNFDLELAEKLRATCPDDRGMGPDWEAPMFACHQSRDRGEIPCAGWLAKVGHRSPRVRVAVLERRLDPKVLEPAPHWPPLWDTYQQVMTQLYATSEPATTVGSRYGSDMVVDLDEVARPKEKP